MEIKILAVGDICGEPGLDCLREKLKAFKEENNIGFCVVNGENANVVGITPKQANDIFKSGADVITLGNHTWTRTELRPYLDERSRIIRPANYAPQCPGRGYCTTETYFGSVTVLNLIGRFTLDNNTDNPFVYADEFIEHCDTLGNIILLPNGTGYITDLGMTGAKNSVLGNNIDQSIGKFLGDPPIRYNSAPGPRKLEGCIFSADTETGRCIKAEAVRI